MAEPITVARPYAEAAYALARDGSALPVWAEMLRVATAVVSQPQVRAALHAHGARYDGDRLEHDVYYNHPARDFAVTDEALRVRYIGEDAVMTYKGAKLPGTRLKAREELNLSVEDGHVLEAMLDRLGFRRTAVVRKRRELWTTEGASIALDEVERLGTFAEVEIIGEAGDGTVEERVHAIARSLGITGQPITSSYLELVLAEGPGLSQD
jgi:adenylate cyclase class 2